MNSTNETKNSTGNTDGAGDNAGPQRLSDAEEGAAQNTNGGYAAETTDASAGLKAEVDKFKNDYLYLRAEFENYKRQVIKERSDLRKFGAERLVVDLLGILDIFETALSTELTAESMSTFRKGIDMTASELRSVLSRHGVEEIAASGKPFDPAVHEALSSEETNDAPAGTVTRVFKKPYKMHDRVVRPGQVVVAKPKS